MAVVASKKKTTASATDNTKTSTNKTNTGTFTTSAGNTYNTFDHEDFVENPYQKSDAANQAWDTINQKRENAPGAWTDPYKDKYMGYLNQYENRDPFSYDFNSDALYQQYKDQYIQQGQMAMMDTMGQAAAMTGGYGNSYAQTVGQQVYNQYLGQLNDKMPELYDRAYGRYQQEGQDMLNMYNAYLGLSDSEYNKYLGEVDNYYKDLDTDLALYNTLSNEEFNIHQANENMRYNVWNTNTSIDQSNWATQLGIESNENQTIMNQNFQAGENQKDRDYQTVENQKNRDHQSSENQKSQTFQATENQKDRDLTVSENDKSRTVSNTPTYTKLEVGSNAYNTMATEVKRVETVDQLKNLVSKYKALGYDPEQIEALTIEKYNELNSKGPAQNENPLSKIIGWFN